MLPDRPAPDFTLKSFFNGGPEEEFTLSSVKGNYFYMCLIPFSMARVLL